MDDATQTTIGGLLEAATAINEVIVGIAAAWVLVKCWQLLRKAVNGKGG